MQLLETFNQLDSVLPWKSLLCISFTTLELPCWFHQVVSSISSPGFSVRSN